MDRFSDEEWTVLAADSGAKVPRTESTEATQASPSDESDIGGDEKNAE